MTPYVGAVFAFGFDFAPIGWNLCDGSLLSISEYQVLYSLIGTTYGGDGSTNFAVPNLSGRVPVGVGQGPGLSNYPLAQKAGNERITLLPSNLPSHTHTVLSSSLPVSGVSGNASSPYQDYFGVADSVIGSTYSSTGGGAALGTNPTAQSGITGSGYPIEIMNPYLTVNYCIAIEGMYPPRS